MLHRVWTVATIWTLVGIVRIQSVAVITQENRVTRAQLRESASCDPWQARFFRLINRRRVTAQDYVPGISLNCVGGCLCVE
jgi:hypothetical protein